MTSFQIAIHPSRRAAARIVTQTRRMLQLAVADAKKRGVTQSDIAANIGVHRSVISRELRGDADIMLGRIGELGWAMGLEPHFELRKPSHGPGENTWLQSASPVSDTPVSSDTSVSVEKYDINEKFKELVGA